MEWHDEGIVLSARRHGESSAILEVMSRAHGRHLGLVRGGRSRRLQPVLQPGNQLSLIWRARLDEHLGVFQVEPIAFNAARLLESATAIHGLLTLAAHLRLLPERDPHAALYETLLIVIDHLGDVHAAAELLARFELVILDELGFGLDLTSCAATGATEGLAYVSPKTGRAVSADAGRPWASRMLPLPVFLRKGERSAADLSGIEAAFRLTGHFFSRHVYEPRAISPPEARASFLDTVRRALAEEGETAA